MTPIAITFLILALTVIWGGLIASIIFLAIRPQVKEYPPGAPDEEVVSERRLRQNRRLTPRN